MAFTAATSNIDLEYVFSYPLTPVPLSMCRGDGTMIHTDKSKLFQMLENTVGEHGCPSFVGTYIIDGNFQLHCMSPNQPENYGDLSRSILISLLAKRSRRIDIVFDTYERPSIKDHERERRAAVVEKEMFITGPEQKRDTSFKKLLERESFKRELPGFLKENWSSSLFLPLLQDKELYLGVMGDCTRYFVEHEAIHTHSVPSLNCNHSEADTSPSLNCNHSEADTRVVLHMIHADKITPRDIVIRASDTNILVLLLHNVHRGSSTAWMETGTRGQGNVRYLNFNKIAAEIGRTQSVIKDLEEFVCALYGAKKRLPLNKHRFNVVDKTYNRRANTVRPFDKLKSIAASSIPPCEAELAPHIDRAAFVARMWGNAHQQYLDKIPSSGWEYADREYRVIWFHGEQLPPALLPRIENTTELGDCDLGDDASESGDLNMEDDDHEPLPAKMEWSDEEDELTFV